MVRKSQYLNCFVRFANIIVSFSVESDSGGDHNRHLAAGAGSKGPGTCQPGETGVQILAEILEDPSRS